MPCTMRIFHPVLHFVYETALPLRRRIQKYMNPFHLNLK